jgi:hypothetical protein
MAYTPVPALLTASAELEFGPEAPSNRPLDSISDANGRQMVGCERSRLESGAP